VNWILGDSRLSQTENMKSKHVQSNRPIHTGTADTTRVWCVPVDRRRRCDAGHGRQLGLAARPPISSDVVGLRQAKVNTLWTATYEYRPKYLHYTPRDSGDLSANCSDFARRSRESRLNSHRLTSQHRQHCLVAGVNWALRCMGTPKCPCD